MKVLFVCLSLTLLGAACGPKPASVAAPPPVPTKLTPVDDVAWKELESHVPSYLKIGIGGKGKDGEPLGSMDVKPHGNITILAQTEPQNGPVEVEFSPKAGGQPQTMVIGNPVSNMGLPKGEYRVAVRGKGSWRVAVYR
ncbi:hypothetical protein EON81_06660 [bacterium]|nr:MAG: hypothetical protein EON81_06660 [bacterium]